jgi:MoxR-like ATPase
MRDLMLTGFELSRISGVPMLYLGNPGMGKTTIVNLWAKRNGYHVESLIGSAFDRSEILGYMVNDGSGTDYLRTKAPEWFHTITGLEKKGTPSVLFIDEIAGAP